MGTIIIRKATQADLPVLLTFEQGIVAAERPFDATLKEGTIHYYDIAAMIDAAHVEVFVAEADGELIGSGYARIQDAKVYQVFTKYTYLGFMYVTPEWRGKGVNKLILEGLKTWTLQQGITEMRLEVYDENEAAMKAYEKAGFRKNLVEMRLPL
ncbi:GNAT family N-acetyltransferase [Chitinophaga arvensicola]|uniref:L-amino acid N-acyltransferase YncA n=1 Tax=Chitinophaga arvensicola TaxID=29529 RepID=A0A1I0S945_9BACT|nr:GNAT family N-acetyltransferase [Chitinophaga arvensicola]SEW52652.1 L-amino acid N-acyltransferase YncA [Chitinophaga arvensicola]